MLGFKFSVSSKAVGIDSAAEKWYIKRIKSRIIKKASPKAWSRLIELLVEAFDQNGDRVLGEEFATKKHG